MTGGIVDHYLRHGTLPYGYEWVSREEFGDDLVQKKGTNDHPLHWGTICATHVDTMTEIATTHLENAIFKSHVARPVDGQPSNRDPYNWAFEPTMVIGTIFDAYDIYDNGMIIRKGGHGKPIHVHKDGSVIMKGKRRLPHRLVLEAAMGTPIPHRFTADHISRNRLVMSVNDVRLATARMQSLNRSNRGRRALLTEYVPTGPEMTYPNAWVSKVRLLDHTTGQFETVYLDSPLRRRVQFHVYSGRIRQRSGPRGTWKVRRGRMTNNGYTVYAFRGYSCLAHRLVALNNPSLFTKYRHGHVVNHIDGDRSHNESTNLEWVSHTENITRALGKSVCIECDGQMYSGISQHECAKQIFKALQGKANAPAIATIRNWIHGRTKAPAQWRFKVLTTGDAMRPMPKEQYEKIGRANKYAFIVESVCDGVVREHRCLGYDEITRHVNGIIGASIKSNVLTNWICYRRIPKKYGHVIRSIVRSTESRDGSI